MVKAIASSPQATPISAAGATAATWFLRGVRTCTMRPIAEFPQLPPCHSDGLRQVQAGHSAYYWLPSLCNCMGVVWDAAAYIAIPSCMLNSLWLGVSLLYRVHRIFCSTASVKCQPNDLSYLKEHCRGVAIKQPKVPLPGSVLR